MLSVSSQNSLPGPKSQGFSSSFFSRSFIVFCFTFKSVIHFELIFVQDVRLRSRFIFPCGCPVAPVPYVDRLCFLHWIAFVPSSKISWGASLVAQWLRICLLMQGTRVRALVWEDPTCRGATRPVSHKY